ncbi:unnamed protein product [Cyclocybe aegerita]|uniref:Methyltransferase domain-containing protein n=1 Tax=Cyclocybe aegerita TaxID=1973307 RepID=A0A8S0X5U4_CYCAE|nr:unnamed protein product [Cyclocybe aegerita]
MASVRPFSYIIPSDWDPLHRKVSPPSPPSPNTPPPGHARRRSHYRPFSTLYTESPYIEFDGPPATCRKRVSSIGGLQAFAAMGMGMNFMDRGKKREREREERTEACRLLPIKVTDSVVSNPRPTTPSPLCDSLAPPNAQDSSPSSSRLAPVAPRVKKKRSMVSLFNSSDSPSSDDSPLRSHSPSLSPPQKPEDTQKLSSRKHMLRNAKQGDVDPTQHFVPKSIWAKRHNMKLHPYQGDAPYMQAYDPILLESDRYTDILFQRLSNGSPSFYDYGKKPPANVLDLGCGPGYWILHGANVWRNTKFTGFDLVDITLAAFETMENVEFVQGNFLRYRLPFPDKSFDFVRMANLVLCIPYEQWGSLLSEVRRVLTDGGRLEFIDDEMLFPCGTAPKDPPSSLTPSVNDLHDDFGFSEDDDTLHDDSGDTESTLHSSEGGSLPSSFEDRENSLSESPTVRPLNVTACLRTPSPPHMQPSETAVFQTRPRPIQSTTYPRYSRHAAWQNQSIAARELEAIFRMMLKQRFNIMPEPFDFVSELVVDIFGKSVAKTKTFKIKLAAMDSPIGLLAQAKAKEAKARADAEREDLFAANSDSPSFASVKKGLKPWKPSAIGIDWEKQPKQPKVKKEKEEKEKWTGTGKKGSGSGSGSSSKRSSLEVPRSAEATVLVWTPVPPSVNAKAAGRLGLDYQPGLSPTLDKSFTRTPPAPPTPNAVNGNSETPLTATPTPSTAKTVTPTTAKFPLTTMTTPTPMSTTARPTTPTPPSSTSKTAPLTMSISKSKSTPFLSPTAFVTPPPVPPPITSSQTQPPRKGAPILSAKAAGRLGISYTALAAATASSRRHVSDDATLPRNRHWINAGDSEHHPVQSPGILVSTGQYIAMGPAELEMHACKYVHTLLGCRPALSEFVRGFRDEEGRKFVKDKEFAEAVWEYECFRRARFNWPDEVADPYEDDPTNASTFSFALPSPTTLTPPSSNGPSPDAPLSLKGSHSSSGSSGSSIRSSSPSPTSKPPRPDKLTKSHSDGNSSPSIHSNGHKSTSSAESFDGQHQDDELTHIRTIRVFQAIKTEHGLVGKLVGKSTGKKA